MSNRGTFRGVGRGRSRTATVQLWANPGNTGLPSTGVIGAFEVPFAATIEKIKVLQPDATTGSAVLDLYRLSESEVDAAIAPSTAYSICAQSKPTIASGTRYTDTTLAGWNTKIQAGDWIFINLDSLSLWGRFIVSLTLRRYFT